jgi:hypothetical protein
MQLPAPTGLTARFLGPSGGSTTYYYWVQAIYPDGNSPLSASANTGSKAQASLTSSQFNQVEWDPAPGAIGYIVWKSTSSTAPGTGGTATAALTSETGIKDDGTWQFTATTPRYDGLYVAKAVYNFAVDGGAVGAIIPALSDTIPANAIVIGGVINSTTAVTSAGAATVSVGTSAGSGAATILAATGKASFSIDAIQYYLAGTGPFGAAAFKMTAAGQINITVAVAALTAGIVEIFVFYVLPANS